ncbi:MAG: 4-(cytidine 5'-diphospho)-2-C-methyl-D-erythritol kinase [Bacteroidales bacterium]|nr:4-(cytidine 5'-diphospho)-2-C-methyl-D-erythritol kinase [Bacteroidales bacterium]MBR5532782.1 4-(cytidine 5'-diphospho)-2-C-methyl-D-erythritol kinase [Bacteroidales bacterium]
MIVFPNAKINLGLNIVSKRDDGYHNIESVFYPIPIYDILEVIPSSDDINSFKLEVIGLPDDGKPNLVEKAYRALLSRYKIPSVDVILKKGIPFAAGLGGGSSDAAYMLKLLSEMFIKDIDPCELHQIGSTIGADVPFFIKNRTVFAEGIGTEFTEIDLSLKDYFIVLIKPDIAISTAEAYSGVVPTKPKHNLREVIKLPVCQWKGLVKNDFEDSLFPKYPRLNSIKESLYQAGAEYASMSGSGSSIFGIFKEMPNKESINHITTNNELIFIEKLM